MKEYVIVTDAGSDLGEELINKTDITVVPLGVKFDDQEQTLESNKVDAVWLYGKLRDGGVAKTSAANIDTFKNCFEPILKEGKDILYIGFSSKLSCTVNNARLAGEELKENYPQNRVVVIDSLSASLGHGLLVYKAFKLKQNGASIDEVAKWTEENKLNLVHLFTVDDLVYLKRGGRVSATTAVVGGLLGIKPILHVDDEGGLVSIGKVRGRKASFQEMVNLMKKVAYKDTADEVFISHGDCLEEAEELAKMIKDQLGFANIKIDFIGPTIGSHSGPGTIALFFMGNKR